MSDNTRVCAVENTIIHYSGTNPPVVGFFEKVSFGEFMRAIKSQFGEDYFSESRIKEMYENIKLPKRATRGSAGYDFFSPFYFFLPSWGDITIPTGIKASIAEGWFLGFYPRSGSGMKHYLRIANTIGIVDSDYFNSAANEGHIMVKLRKESDQYDTNTPTIDVEFEEGSAFCQAIFLPYGITMDDDASGLRTGGFGSTGA